MKRFTLSTFSVLLTVMAIAPTAQALPKVDADFKLQTLRLSEMDARNKSEDDQQPYYPYGKPQTQMPAQPAPTNPNVEQTDPADTGSTTASEDAEESNTSRGLSLTERRQQSLDRS